jgi:hypothetical protein
MTPHKKIAAGAQLLRAGAGPTTPHSRKHGSFVTSLNIISIFTTHPEKEQTILLKWSASNKINSASGETEANFVILKS